MSYVTIKDLPEIQPVDLSGNEYIMVTDGTVDSVSSKFTVDSMVVYVGEHFDNTVDGKLELKVDKITGKGLSTEDFSTMEKNKLSSLENYVHPESGIPAGEYTKLTIDSLGHATAGSNPDTLLGYGITDAINSSDLGQPGGVATLDENGVINLSQIPVNILEYNTTTSFPITGEYNKIYISLDTNKLYRWTGVIYTQLGSLVNSVAGRTGSIILSKADVYLTNVDNTADINKNVFSATKLTTARTINNVSFDGTSNIIIEANDPNKVTSNASILGGTNTKLTYDSKGLVTAGTSLSSSDIPNLDADKITSGIISADRLPSYVANVQEALDSKVDDNEKGSANGVATLDVNGKVTLTQIPDSVLGQLEYHGVWDFTTLPTATQKGQYWIASVAGNGYLVGDWAVWNELSFDKVDNTDAVASVAGRTGNVVLTKSDVELSLVDNTTDASKNVLSATKLTTPRNIALTGDVTGSVNFDGSGNVTGTSTLATITDSGTGTFKKITTNTKGLVTGTQAVSQADITGLLGTGSITNIMLANTAVTNLSGTNTGDQTITLTGDVTGAGTGSFATTLANSGVTAGTFSKVTVDAKGRVTAGLIPTMEDIPDATFKRSVKVATTANITLSAPQTIDGIAVVAGDRVLVKNQTTTSQNGIYVVNAGAWTRGLDANTSSKISSALVAVDSGTINGGKLFDNDFKTTDTLGTTAMLWNMNLDDGSLLTSGSTSIGMVKYNGTTAVAGQFDGGATTPTGIARLNYGGYFYPTYLNLTASGVETAASSHILMEKSSDGFVRRKTLANFKTEMFASPTLATPTISGKSTNPYISINRADTSACGIEWYNSTQNTWIDYMAQAGVAAQGPKGNITPSAGTLVTSWGKRSFIENTTGFGWTFESGVTTSTSPTVVAEISSVDGSAKFGGTVTAPSFVGSLSGNSNTATALQTARTINGVSFNGTANITIPAATINIITTEFLNGYSRGGLPIYGIEVNIGLMPNATVKNVAFTFNIAYTYWIDNQNSYCASSTASYPLNYSGNIGESISCFLDRTNNLIKVFTSDDKSTFNGKLVILYTK